VYIPGDTPIILENERYLNKVRAILQWAQTKNQDDHFPLVAVSYGYLALMMAGIQNEGTIKTVDNFLQWTSAELQNLFLTTSHFTTNYLSMSHFKAS
jgi:hypothetical protein